MSDLYLPLRSVHMTCPALSILGTIEPDTVARALHGGVHGGPHGVGEAMAARVNAPGARGVAEVADFMLLQAINRWQALLLHWADAANIHPETLYAAYVEMAAEFAPQGASRLTGGEAVLGDVVSERRVEGVGARVDGEVFGFYFENLGRTCSQIDFPGTVSGELPGLGIAEDARVEVPGGVEGKVAHSYLECGRGC